MVRTSAAIRIRATGLVAVVGVVIAAMTPAAAAAPPRTAVPGLLDPPPPGSVELMPGDIDVLDKLVTEDAVWVRVGDVVHRRSVTTTPTTVSLGRAEAVARVGGGRFAVHDGTLAYTRPVDGRVVLRAPDGSEEVPAWGADAAFRDGVAALSGDWVAGGSFLAHDPVSRVTGEPLGLLALSTEPAGSTSVSLGPVLFTDTRVLWSAGGALPVGGWSRCYTAALTPTGVVGPVTVLDTATRTGQLDREGVQVATVSGSLVAWHHEYDDPTPGPQQTLFWHVAPPYVGTPMELDAAGTLPTYLGLFTGTQRVTRTAALGGHRFDWQDLAAADPGAVVRTITLPFWAGVSIAGPLVAYSDSIASSGDPYETWFLDVDRRPITADQRAPVTLPSFRDVLTYQDFADEILWLADRGVVGGFADGTFRGLAAINRDAVAAFLYRAAHPGGVAPVCVSAPFTDVPVSHPFCGEIAWLASTGVVRGWVDGSFRPGLPVTREAMAAFVYRLVHGGGDAPGCVSAPFADVAVGNPFCGAVAWLAQTGVSTGWPDGTYRPAQSIERQAMAAFLFRMLDWGLLPAADG